MRLVYQIVGFFFFNLPGAPNVCTEFSVLLACLHQRKDVLYVPVTVHRE